MTGIDPGDPPGDPPEASTARRTLATAPSSSRPPRRGPNGIRGAEVGVRSAAPAAQEQRPIAHISDQHGGGHRQSRPDAAIESAALVGFAIAGTKPVRVSLCAVHHVSPPRSCAVSLPTGMTGMSEHGEPSGNHSPCPSAISINFSLRNREGFSPCSGVGAVPSRPAVGPSNRT